jgi:hypothetical protein
MSVIIAHATKIREEGESHPEQYHLLRDGTFFALADLPARHLLMAIQVLGNRYQQMALAYDRLLNKLGECQEAIDTDTISDALRDCHEELESTIAEQEALPARQSSSLGDDKTFLD